MTKAVRVSLIVASSTISAGIISAVSYVVGKKKGYELGSQQTIADLNSAPTEAPRNTRREQAQA